LVVPENQRLQTLRQLGLSEPLIRQALGDKLHPLFWFRCQGPPWKSYHGAVCPPGPPLAPLWDCCDTVTGVWERDGRLEFIEFGIEWNGDHAVLAYTEQGLWATIFWHLYEDSDDPELEDFPRAAQIVGFRFFDQLVEQDKAAQATYEKRRARLRDLVAAIDHSRFVSCSSRPCSLRWRSA